MRILNSICKVLADKYKGVPVYIEEVPEGFARPSFFVSLTTEGSALKNKKVVEDTPLYQIVYFGRQNAATQVKAERLYEIRSELKALFLLPGAMKVITDTKKEKQRYAKVTSFNAEVRHSEDSLYARLGLSFTEDTVPDPDYDLIQNVELDTNVRNGG